MVGYTAALALPLFARPRATWPYATCGEGDFSVVGFTARLTPAGPIERPLDGFSSLMAARIYLGACQATN